MTPSHKTLDTANLCWSETGIWGNRSCPDLAAIGSCMQCRQINYLLLCICIIKILCFFGKCRYEFIVI